MKIIYVPLNALVLVIIGWELKEDMVGYCMWINLFLKINYEPLNDGVNT